VLCRNCSAFHRFSSLTSQAASLLSWETTQAVDTTFACCTRTINTRTTHIHLPRRFFQVRAILIYYFLFIKHIWAWFFLFSFKFSLMKGCTELCPLDTFLSLTADRVLADYVPACMIQSSTAAMPTMMTTTAATATTTTKATTQSYIDCFATFIKNLFCY
jgi:hypothetical protein